MTFKCRKASECQSASACQFVPNRQTVARNGHFEVFKMVAVRHLGFLKFEILTAGIRFLDQYVSMCQK